MSFRGLLAWAQRRAENVAAFLLLAMFLVFLIQIASRYLMNLPTGWTHETSVMLWIWLVLFGAAFVIRDHEEMRFDLIYGAARDKARRAMALFTAVATVGLFLLSLPATWDYVTFMKVERTAYLHIPFNWVYSIYVVFAVAMIVRHIWIGFAAIYGRGPEAYDPTKASSGV
jgi:C4-dicarboxylate transporter DctQ subunit